MLVSGTRAGFYDPTAHEVCDFTRLMYSGLFSVSLNRQHATRTGFRLFEPGDRREKIQAGSFFQLLSLLFEIVQRDVDLVTGRGEGDGVAAVA